MKNLSKPVIIFLCIGLLFFTASCQNQLVSAKHYGNTNGNISIGGLLVEDVDENVYVIAKDKGNHILRKKPDDVVFETIYEESAYSLNVTVDYLYFVNISDNIIYCMSLKNHTISKVSDVKVNRFLIVEDQIFFEDAEDHQKLCCMPIEGTVPVCLKEGINGFSITNQYIYYIDTTDYDTVYRMYYDGSHAEKIIDASTIHMIATEEHLYYSTYTSSDGISQYQGLFQYDLHTNTEKLISEKGIFFNIYGDVLYHEEKNIPSPVVKANLDGSNPTRLVNGQCEFIFCSQNYLLVKKILAPDLLIPEDIEYFGKQIGNVWILCNRTYGEQWIVVH